MASPSVNVSSNTLNPKAKSMLQKCLWHVGFRGKALEISFARGSGFRVRSLGLRVRVLGFG